MAEDLKTKLEELIKPLVISMGYEFWGFVLQKQKVSSLIRVYIDSERGITLDDCSRVSYQLSGVLDVEDIMPYRYTLEVSSPGLDRPLFKKEQYRKFIGSKVQIKLNLATKRERRNYSGVMVAVTDNDVTIESEDNKIVLPFSEIERAHLMY